MSTLAPDTGYDVSVERTSILSLDDLAQILGVGHASIRTYHGRAAVHRREAEATGDPTKVRPGDLPAPDGYLYQKAPYWTYETIDKWLDQRPGRGGHNKATHKANLAKKLADSKAGN